MKVALPNPALSNAAGTTDGRSLRRHRNAERLYDAASELLAHCDFDDLNVDDICARAKVGRATFFRIYETKAGLLQEFNRRLAVDATIAIDQAEPSDLRAALEEVRHVINDAWRDAAPGQVGMAKATIQTNTNSNLHAAHPELLDLVTDLITTAIDNGEIPNTIPADLAASLAVIHLTAAIAHFVAGRNVDIDELSRTLLNQWHAGMTSTRVASE